MKKRKNSKLKLEKMKISTLSSQNLGKFIMGGSASPLCVPPTISTETQGQINAAQRS